MIIKILFSFVLSFLVAFYLIPIISAVAVRLNILDVPDGRIKKHKQPTPYLGGIAVYVAFIVSLALTFPFENHMFAFFIGSTLLLFVGLIDDLVPLRPYQKFSGQIIAALCFLRAGFLLKTHFFMNYWALPISFFWMLSIINAFNLVDVMDGLATTIAGCATLSFFIIALYFGQTSVALLLSALFGALLAFFWYNKPRASIYLGDAGSLFIGGLMASVPFMIHWGKYHWYGYVSPVIVLAIPLLEVGALVLIRTYKKIPFYLPSPDHFSLYLRRNGWSKWEILIYVILMSIILFVASFLFLTGFIGWIMLFITAGFFMAVWTYLLYKRRK